MLGELARRFVGDRDRISAVVLADNEVGRAFYDARGFSVVGERETSFSGVERDELIVRADLDDLAGLDDASGGADVGSG
ncbi:hypothetical protein [Halorarum halobium]|uniref:hypothetical protein n=1 Tax=Halorarum halobium TaxID=3075121 RepID=UPI0028AB5BC8|nr:hypothetical protein [Halobaculum sp. XH14]